MVSNKAAKYLITTPLLVLLLLAQVVLMLQCMHLMDEAAATFGADSWLQVGVGCLLIRQSVSQPATQMRYR